jgi:hypothetical protein
MVTLRHLTPEPPQATLRGPLTGLRAAARRPRGAQRHPRVDRSTRGPSPARRRRSGHAGRPRCHNGSSLLSPDGDSQWRPEPRARSTAEFLRADRRHPHRRTPEGVAGARRLWGFPGELARSSRPFAVFAGPSRPEKAAFPRLRAPQPREPRLPQEFIGCHRPRRSDGLYAIRRGARQRANGAGGAEPARAPRLARRPTSAGTPAGRAARWRGDIPQASRPPRRRHPAGEPSTETETSGRPWDGRTRPAAARPEPTAHEAGR